MLGVVHRGIILPSPSSGWAETAKRDSLPSFYEQKAGCSPLHMNCKVIKNLTDFSDTDGKYFEKFRGLVCCNQLN